MIPTNQNISTYLDRYITYKNPQFAVMITGDWGCGKTYFIKQWIEKVKLIHGHHYLPLYISLYGVQSIAEVKDSINHLLHPILTSNIVKNAKKIGVGLAKTLIKCDLGDNDKPVEVSYELDLLPLFQSENKEINASGKILVFDDLERCHINRTELLGFLNFFVEHCGCKVILLCNETKMTHSYESRIFEKIEDVEGVKESWKSKSIEEVTNDRDYFEFKEKTVGSTFELKAGIKEALSSFIRELAFDPQDLISNMKSDIAEMLSKAEQNNLRILRQCLLDFNSIVEKVPTNLRQKEAYATTMRKLLLNLLIIQMEKKSWSSFL